MAILFPPTPSPNAIFGKWQFDGQHWVLHDPAAPFVSKAGDTMGGQLEQPLAPVADDDLANKKYCDDAVSTGQLWRGTWAVASNTPDLTTAAALGNGYAWTAITADPHVEEQTTVALPGIPVGTTVANGDRLVYAEGPPAEFFLIHAAGITQADADARYAQIVNAFVRGTPGTYTQGTDFDGAGLPTIQQFLDSTINNHWFDGAVTVNFSTGLPGGNVLQNVFMGVNVLNLVMNSTVDSVGEFSIRSVSLVTLSGSNTNGFGALNVTSDGNVTLSYAGNTVPFDLIVSRSSTVAVGAGYSILAGNVTVTSNSLLSVNNNTTFACTGLTNNGGTVVIQDTGTYSGPIVRNFGIHIDNRAGNTLDTFMRPPGQTYPQIAAFTASNVPAPAGEVNPIQGFRLSATIAGWTLAQRGVFFLRGSYPSPLAPRFVNINTLGDFPLYLRWPTAFASYGGMAPAGLPTDPRYIHRLDIDGRTWGGELFLALRFDGFAFYEAENSRLYDYITNLRTGRNPRLARHNRMMQSNWGINIPMVQHELMRIDVPNTSNTMPVAFLAFAHCPQGSDSILGGRGRLRFNPWSVHNRRYTGEIRRLLFRTQGTLTPTLRFQRSSHGQWDRYYDGSPRRMMSNTYTWRVAQRLRGTGIGMANVSGTDILVQLPATGETEITYRVNRQSYGQFSADPSPHSTYPDHRFGVGISSQLDMLDIQAMVAV